MGSQQQQHLHFIHLIFITNSALSDKIKIQTKVSKGKAS